MELEGEELDDGVDVAAARTCAAINERAMVDGKFLFAPRFSIFFFAKQSVLVSIAIRSSSTIIRSIPYAGLRYGTPNP